MTKETTLRFGKGRKMNRLTKKLKNEDEYCLVVNDVIFGFFATNKLGKLEDIEEELGCSLEVIFKALKDGIIDIENQEHRHIHLRDNGTYVFPNGWIFHTYHFTYEFKLSDYQKTWWLKGEK
jgi:hypothetical protein